MATTNEGKKLSDLLIIELRTALKQRGLKHFGTKEAIKKRLEKALISEGHKPETYIFTDYNSDNKMDIVKETINNDLPDLEQSNQTQNDTSVLMIEASLSETDLEIEKNNKTDSSTSKTETLETDTKNDSTKSKVDSDTSINDSFVLMIDELIPDTFLEESSEKATPDKNSNETVELNTEIENNKNVSISELNPSEEIIETKLTVSVDLKENDTKIASNNHIEEPQTDLSSKINSQDSLVIKENIVINTEEVSENTSEDNNTTNGIEKKKINDDKKNEETNEQTTNEKAENEEIETNSTSTLIPSETTDKENNIFKITNIVFNTKAQELKQLLSKYGNVAEIKVLHDNKKKICYAFVRINIENEEDLKNIKFKGLYLKITKFETDKNILSDKADPKIHSLKGLIKKNLETSQKIETRDVDRNLWVTNLLQDTKAQEIKHLLSQYAKVIGVKVVKSSSQPNKNCYGYVTMESKAAVDICIRKLDRTVFNGRIIRLSATKKAPVLDNTADNANKKSPLKHTKETNNKVMDKKKTQELNVKENEKIKINENIKIDETSKKEDNGKKKDEIKKDDIIKKEENKFENSEAKKYVTILNKNRLARERIHQREKDRIKREEDRRLRQQIERARELSRRQREEARQIEREREKLRKEREQLERQRSEIMRLERERQRFEREKIEQEKIELKRQQQRLEDARRAEKRSSSSATSIPNKRAAADRQYNDVPASKIEIHKTKDASKDYKLRDSKQTDRSHIEDYVKFSKRLDDYSKSTDTYNKRTDESSKHSEDYSKRIPDYPKRSDHYNKNIDDYPKRSDDYKRSNDYYSSRSVDYSKRNEEHYPKHDDYSKHINDYEMKRDYLRPSDHSMGHSSHIPSTINTMNPYNYESTSYHQSRDKQIRENSRKDLIPSHISSPRETKPINYSERIDKLNTSSYRSVPREGRDRDRKIDYNFKTETRIPLIKEGPTYRDDVNTWQSSVSSSKNYRVVDNTNVPKDWWRKSWETSWETSNTQYPADNYNSGPACPPPPGINSFTVNSHFGNYSRKY